MNRWGGGPIGEGLWLVACLVPTRVWRRAHCLMEIIEATARRPACGALSLEHCRRDTGQRRQVRGLTQSSKMGLELLVVLPVPSPHPHLISAVAAGATPGELTPTD